MPAIFSHTKNKKNKPKVKPQSPIFPRGKNTRHTNTALLQFLVPSTTWLASGNTNANLSMVERPYLTAQHKIISKDTFLGHCRKAYSK
jgi:hypothetical protein